MFDFVLWIGLVVRVAYKIRIDQSTIRLISGDSPHSHQQK